MEAWKGFFNHDFWEQEAVQESTKKSFASYAESETEYNYRETEEFIEYMFPVNLEYEVELDCTVTQDGWRATLLSKLLRKGDRLKPKKKLEFSANTTAPKPYEVYWKIKNKGIVAKRRDEVRGQIQKGTLQHKEKTEFKGEHFAEVYIVKNGVCVSRERIDVPISE
ncbi:hypothetical protein [Terribacillus sp. 7520-G]|uniref:nucleotide-binding domain-containing protein n=1 Tax=Terribacillus sp. 7520-G TaxID=2025389 RepID=UPI001E47CB16|nr:hypothetical protein [Terribacillus sp. 7520-G]